MLALNPSSQHHRSQPAVTNPGVRSNQSWSAMRSSGGRGERGGKRERKMEKDDGVEREDQEQPAFFLQDCFRVVVIVDSTGVFRGEQPLTSTRQPPCSRSAPDRLAGCRGLSCEASRRRQSPVSGTAKGAPPFPFVRASLPPSALTKRPWEHPIIICNRIERLGSDLVECLMSAGHASFPCAFTTPWRCPFFRTETPI
ncbi:PREDICTED: uncharacterized protein LOC108763231 [Trachymyrmex cornetzi]|uniref:uncharacterized protein LOC108763231 n=1 Tax=Trachymyrmex cornetzi TaxID=471704 RepID=UPI00084EFAFA|nr:PREDICTED: uncharacterized protein LOC108763231 [Trachymyrmex cornetzi]